MGRYNYDEWMTPEQRECYELLCDLYYGEHHLTSEVKPCGKGIQTSVLGDLATYDFNHMTRAVIMAHDRAIRVAVRSSGPGRLMLQLHKRQREGSMCERHPTIEDAIAKQREEKAAGGKG